MGGKRASKNIYGDDINVEDKWDSDAIKEIANGGSTKAIKNLITSPEQAPSMTTQCPAIVTNEKTISRKIPGNSGSEIFKKVAQPFGKNLLCWYQNILKNLLLEKSEVRCQSRWIKLT